APRSAAAVSICPNRGGRADRRSDRAPAKAQRRRAPDARRRRRGEKTGAANGRRAKRRSYRSSSQPEFAFGVTVQRPPEHAIDDDDEQAHNRDAEHDTMKIAGIGLLSNIGAEPFS